MRQLFQVEAYTPPHWAQNLQVTPTNRYMLGLLPTPIHKWEVPGADDTGVEFFIKRDDLSGLELSGNKVRKLEFILSEAKALGHDSVITIGGVQSNHCRATAVAARYVGLEAHLILRTSAALVDGDPGLVGNLLPERLVGSFIHLATKEEYSLHGSENLLNHLFCQLKEKGLNPYVIPVGGSSPLGCWGYIEFIHELSQQISNLGITDLVLACGSGGTVAGIALANFLSKLNLRVHAYGVCDTPQYFERFINTLMTELGITNPDVAGMVRLVQARGAGYAISTESELQLLGEVASRTAIVLDPVYTGKAFVGLMNDIKAEEPTTWRGRKVLFLHTGGLLGLYEKSEQLQMLNLLNRCRRLVL